MLRFPAAKDVRGDGNIVKERRMMKSMGTLLRKEE
jgi:hypothetical protein